MITLRPLSAGDAKELFPLLQGVAEKLVEDGPASEEGLEAALLERVQLHEQGMVRAFTIFKEDIVIGSIRLKFNLTQESGEIGVWLGRSFQGQGYGSQAIGWVMDEGFEVLGLRRIEAHVMAGNVCSEKAFANNGFVWERTLHKGALQRGRFLDVNIFVAVR